MTRLLISKSYFGILPKSCAYNATLAINKYAGLSAKQVGVPYSKYSFSVEHLSITGQSASFAGI